MIEREVCVHLQARMMHAFLIVHLSFLGCNILTTVCKSTEQPARACRLTIECLHAAPSTVESTRRLCKSTYSTVCILCQRGLGTCSVPYLAIGTAPLFPPPLASVLVL